MHRGIYCQKYIASKSKKGKQCSHKLQKHKRSFPYFILDPNQMNIIKNVVVQFQVSDNTNPFTFEGQMIKNKMKIGTTLKKKKKTHDKLPFFNKELFYFLDEYDKRKQT